MLRQICEGLKYLHSHKIAHCDLKPDNFLFVDSSPDSQLKIIDFGMSKFVKRRQYFHSLRGTPYYIAPEVIKGQYNEVKNESGRSEWRRWRRLDVFDSTSVASHCSLRLSCFFPFSSRLLIFGPLAW